MTTAAACWRSTGRTSPDMTTSAPLPIGGEVNPDPELTLFAADTPASHSAQPGRCLAPKTPDTSGRPTSQSFAHFDPDTWSLRTSQPTFTSDSTSFSETLPPAGSMR